MTSQNKEDYNKPIKIKLRNNFTKAARKAGFPRQTVFMMVGLVTKALQCTALCDPLRL